MEESIFRLFQLKGLTSLESGQLLMIVLSCALMYFAVRRNLGPQLLLPIAFGAFLANLPGNELLSAPHGSEPGGLLFYLSSGPWLQLLPLLIFFVIGAAIDFGPMLVRPYVFFLAAATQIGVFFVLFAATMIGFDIKEASSISIIGAADGPTAIYLATKLAPHLLGPIALAAYLFMALVPQIQTPIMRIMTTKEERLMPVDSPPVSKMVRVMFPLMVMFIGIAIAPPAGPLLAMLMGGNLLRETGAANVFKPATQTELLRIATFILGLGAGLTMQHSTFFTWGTPAIIFLGLIGFSLSTACGLAIGKLMCRISGGKVNPLVGTFRLSAAGCAGSTKATGGEACPNYLLLNAMGANVAGIIGSAFAVGILLAIVGS